MTKYRKKNVDLEIWSDFLNRISKAVFQAITYLFFELWNWFIHDSLKLKGKRLIYGYIGNRFVFDYPSNRNGHTSIKGKTGFGKSSLAVNLAIQAIEQGTRTVVIDPDGDPEAIEKGISVEIYRRIKDTKKLTFLSVNQKNKIIGYNPLFLISNRKQLDQLKDELMNSIFYNNTKERTNERYKIANRAKFVLESVIYFHNAYFDWLMNEKNLVPLEARKILRSRQITINDLASLETNPALIDLFIKMLGYKESEYFRPDLVEKWLKIKEKKTFDVGLSGVIGRLASLVATTESELFFESSGFNFLSAISQDDRSVLCDLSKLDDFTVSVISKLILVQVYNLHRRGIFTAQTEMFVDEASNVEIPNIPKIIAQGRKKKLALTLIYQYTSQFKNHRIIQAIAKGVVTKINFRNTEADFNTPLNKIVNLKKREFIIENAKGVYERVRTFNMPPVLREIELNEKGSDAQMLRRKMLSKRTDIFGYFLDIETD